MTITTTTTTMATASTLRDIYRQLEHPYQADFTNYVFMVQPPKYSFTSKSTSKWPQFVLSGGGLAAVHQDQHGEHQGWKGRYVNSFSWRASKRWNHKQIMLLFGRSSQTLYVVGAHSRGVYLFHSLYSFRCRLCLQFFSFATYLFKYMKWLFTWSAKLQKTDIWADISEAPIYCGMDSIWRIHVWRNKT